MSNMRKKLVPWIISALRNRKITPQATRKTWYPNVNNWDIRRHLIMFQQVNHYTSQDKENSYNRLDRMVTFVDRRRKRNVIYWEKLTKQRRRPLRLWHVYDDGCGVATGETPVPSNALTNCHLIFVVWGTTHTKTIATVRIAKTIWLIEIRHKYKYHSLAATCIRREVNLCGNISNCLTTMMSSCWRHECQMRPRDSTCSSSFL